MIPRNNIVVFLALSTSGRPSYASTFIGGFEYSQVDLVDECTKLVPEYSEDDIYQHPPVLCLSYLVQSPPQTLTAVVVLRQTFSNLEYFKCLQD